MLHMTLLLRFLFSLFGQSDRNCLVTVALKCKQQLNHLNSCGKADLCLTTNLRGRLVQLPCSSFPLAPAN